MRKNVSQCTGEKKKTRKRISSDSEEHTKKVRKNVPQYAGEKKKARKRISSDTDEHTKK